MDYTSTPQGLEGFCNSSTGFSEHEVGAWAMHYPLVKVIGSWEVLMEVNN